MLKVMVILATVTFIGYLGHEYQHVIWSLLLSILWLRSLSKVSWPLLEAISSTPLCKQDFVLQ